MISTLLASATVISFSCADIDTLVNRAKVYPDISNKDRQEIIDLYYDIATRQGLDCKDANE